MKNPKRLILRELEALFDETLHPEYAQEWDNVGLLAGDPGQRVSRILLCIDLTEAVLQEAKDAKAELIVAYHPPLFEPVKTIRADRQPILFEAIRSKIAIYSIHTALDVLPGGTSDALADLIDLVDRSPIEILTLPENSQRSKLIVFVPYDADQLEKVSLAIFQAGGGHIGEYSCCSFLSAGHGTFMGSEKSKPAIGKAGEFQTVEEMRMETVVPNELIPQVIEAMKAAHPYEEPAYDVHPCTEVTDENIGLGRMGLLPQPTDLNTLVDTLKHRTGLKAVQVVDSGKPTLFRAAVGPGSCGELLEHLAGHVDLFVTGEIRHHAALSAARSGTSVICLGHGNSERIVLKPLKKMLAEKLKGLEILISKQDVDPLTIR